MIRDLSYESIFWFLSSPLEVRACRCLGMLKGRTHSRAYHSRAHEPTARLWQVDSNSK